MVFLYQNPNLYYEKISYINFFVNFFNKYPIYRNNIEGDKFARLLLRIEIGDYRLEQYYEDIKSKEMIQ